jgi:ribonuclease P protein component
MNAKADVSTKEAQAYAHARLSGAHGHQERPARAQGAEAKEPPAPERVQRMGQEVRLEGKFAATTTPGLALVHKGARTDFRRYAMERRIRLRRTSNVRRVYDEWKSWSHPLLVLIARPNQLGSSRVGVTASRKVGGAVARNRAKRLLREAGRRLYPQLEAGWDVMLVARAAIVEAKETQVEEALASLLKRARLSTRESGCQRGEAET